MKVLICVAHPDDEVLGAGGAIASYVKNGDEVASIIFTYGENSSLVKPRSQLARERIAESTRACKILGVKSLHFLGLPDTTLRRERRTEETKKKVGGLLKKYDPDIILTHSIDDGHPAHTSVAKLVKRQVRSQGLRARIYTFNNWSPIRSKNLGKPKLVVDTSKFFNKKKRALKEFKTQSKTLGWSYNVALTLVKDYWNGVRHGKMTAEVFYKW
jgi:N-acetylglucosamine malate deacetylase 1